MRKTIQEQERKIKSLEKSIQMKDLSLAEADLKIQVNESQYSREISAEILESLNTDWTIKHSSRMQTARLPTVCV